MMYYVLALIKYEVDGIWMAKITHDSNSDIFVFT